MPSDMLYFSYLIDVSVQPASTGMTLHLFSPRTVSATSLNDAIGRWAKVQGLTPPLWDDLMQTMCGQPVRCLHSTDPRVCQPDSIQCQ